jgi:Ca2+-binding EF-hand superfamily protein
MLRVTTTTTTNNIGDDDDDDAVSPSHLVGSPITSHTQWSDRSVYQDAHAHHRSPSPKRRSSLKDGRIFSEVADDRFHKDLESRRNIRRQSVGSKTTLDAHLILSRGCRGRTQRLNASLRKFDSEGGGFVTHDALSRSLHRLGIELNSKEMNGLIHYHDTQGTGFIEIASLVEAVDRASIVKDENTLGILVASARRKIKNSRFALDAKKCLDSFRRCDRTKSGLVTRHDLRRHLALIRVVLRDCEMSSILEKSDSVEYVNPLDHEQDKINYDKFVKFVYDKHDGDNYDVKAPCPPGLAVAEQRRVGIESSYTRRQKLTIEKLGRMIRSCDLNLLRKYLPSEKCLDAKDLRRALSSCGIQIGEEDSVCVMESVERRGGGVIDTIQHFGVSNGGGGGGGGSSSSSVHEHAPWTKKSSTSGLVPDEGKKRQFAKSTTSHGMYMTLRGGNVEISEKRNLGKARTKLYWQQNASSDIANAMKLEPKTNTVRVRNSGRNRPRVLHMKRGFI